MNAPPNRVSAILMASGFSRRFGSSDKLLHPFRGRPLALYTLELACRMPEFSSVVFVAGNDGVAELASGFPARVARNGAPERGVCESIRLGVEAAPAEHYCFFPCDQPLMSAPVVRELLARAKPGFIVEPVSGGAPRSPSIFSDSFRSELISIPCGMGGQFVKERHRDLVVSVPFADGEIFSDVDTLEELNDLQGVRRV